MFFGEAVQAFCDAWRDDPAKTQEEQMPFWVVVVVLVVRAVKVNVSSSGSKIESLGGEEKKEVSKLSEWDLTLHCLGHLLQPVSGDITTPSSVALGTVAYLGTHFRPGN